MATKIRLEFLLCADFVAPLVIVALETFGAA